jgi:hypothetical protein
MNEYSDREPHTFFGHTAILSIEERNELDEYVTGLPEFQKWDEAGFLLGLKQKLLKASFCTGGTAKAIDEACEQLRPDFKKYKELGEQLRRKVKTWCRAVLEDAA